jgi:hypothetical protein
LQSQALKVIPVRFGPFMSVTGRCPLRSGSRTIAPASLTLFGLGLAGLAFARRKRQG